MRHSLIGSTLMAIVIGFAGGAQAAQDKGANAGPSKADHRFIEKVMKDNEKEIALAKVAQERASSDAVKQYAKRLMDDHTKAGSELQAIASRVGYTPKKSSDKEPREVRKFQKMSGEKFDREFAKHMVDDHEKTIKVFKKEAQDGQSQEVWQFATKTLPTLEEHLRIAQELSGSTKRKGRKDS